MLAPALDTIRLTLHVLAATVWVGGQIVMMGLVGPARTLGGDAPQTLARAFARMAWPAYVVLVVTGFWNITTFTWSAQSSAWKAVLMAKIVVVAPGGARRLLAPACDDQGPAGPVGIGGRHRQCGGAGHGHPRWPGLTPNSSGRHAVAAPHRPAGPQGGNGSNLGS